LKDGEQVIYASSLGLVEDGHPIKDGQFEVVFKNWTAG